MSCDPTKWRRYVLWSPLGMLKFNVNELQEVSRFQRILEFLFAMIKVGFSLCSLSMWAFVILMKQRCLLFWKLFVVSRDFSKVLMWIFFEI